MCVVNMFGRDETAMSRGGQREVLSQCIGQGRAPKQREGLCCLETVVREVRAREMQGEGGKDRRKWDKERGERGG